MTMAKSRKKMKPAVLPKPVRSEIKKTEIPDRVLKTFLEQKIGLSKLDNISLIRAVFLWEVEGIGRYRVNVWRKTYKDGQYCPNIKIIHSFWVLYNAEDCLIIDRTEKSKPKKDRIF